MEGQYCHRSRRALAAELGTKKFCKSAVLSVPPGPESLRGGQHCTLVRS